MSVYAVAHLRKVALGPEIITYLEQIDATLAPFGGRFLIHGGARTLLEGSWCGDLIAIAFPDRAAALGWYESAAYQRILALRTDHAEGDVIIVDGVPPHHRATDILAPWGFLSPAKDLHDPAARRDDSRPGKRNGGPT